MPKINMINMKGESAGEIELNPEIFDIEINEHAVYTVVKNLLANRRQGTHSAKTRGEVRGGGRKPWRQKGTGRARHGSIRSPIWKGGGVVFAPKPRDYSYKLPKKVRRLALKSALSSKVENGEMIVVDNIDFEAPKTKEMVEFLSNIKADKKALIVVGESNLNIIKSASNIPNVQTALVNTLNVYDILNHNSFIITKDAVRKVEEVYS